MTPRYCVDGLEFDDPDAPYAGDGQFPPFVIFDIEKQENLPGEYDSRVEAEQVMRAMAEIPNMIQALKYAYAPYQGLDPNFFSDMPRAMYDGKSAQETIGELSELLERIGV